MDRLITVSELRKHLPKRSKDAHKGKFGHVFIIAGSRFYTGAAKLCAKSAMCSGVGLVTLGIPDRLVDVVASGLMEIIFYPLPCTSESSFAYQAIDSILEFAQDKQAVLIGPGLGRHPETVKLVHELYIRLSTPLVVDADGLNALSENAEVLTQRSSPTILTPHPGEMARLAKLSTAEVQRDRVGLAVAMAQRLSVVIVLKGYHTVIANPCGEYVINHTGGHELSKGGTGDVLAGLIAGLLAQGIEPYYSAQIGVWLHGRAGDLAGQQLHPRSVSAGDLFTFIHQAWKELDPHPYEEAP